MHDMYIHTKITTPQTTVALALSNNWVGIKGG